MERRRTVTLGLAVLSAMVGVMAVTALLWAAGNAGASPPMEPLAQGGAPLLLNYQGRLADPTTGLPKPDGTYNITFTIYPAETGGTLIWSETQVVTVTKGLFNVLLGSSTALSASDFDGISRWLELEVEEERLSPRIRIASVPYAIQAEEAKNAWRLTGNAGTTPGTHFLGTTDAVSLTLAVNGTTALRLEPNATSPNLIGGYGGNSVAAGVVGVTVGGGGSSGSINEATANYATVGGGASNAASGSFATISGGESNMAGAWATVGGGIGNHASSSEATVGGGGYNTASGICATVPGGYGNAASDEAATVGGGYDNTASGDRATVGGGEGNTASGWFATVPGGASNIAQGDYSFAAGRHAKANHDGAFVWADSTGTEFASSANDQFMVRATGGVSFEIGSADFQINGSIPWLGSPYSNVVVVAKSGGDFTSVQAALSSITDAKASNPYLIWVAPGTYTETVTMKQYVDIEGAGELVTKITAAGSASENTGTVVGADNAELRFLTVENTGGATFAKAIYNDNASPRLTHVTATASGASNDNYGVHNYYSSPMMTNMTASASEGTWNFGVYNSSSSPTMTNMTASASGGTNNHGISNDMSSPTMTNVTASASGGSDNRGVHNFLGQPTMTNVTASASGGSDSYGMYNLKSWLTIQNSVISASGATNNYGIYNPIGPGPPGGNCIVTVSNSQITGSTNTIYHDDSGVTTLVGASLLNGGPVNVISGTVTCAGVYDENYTFYASTCP